MARHGQEKKKSLLSPPLDKSIALVNVQHNHLAILRIRYPSCGNQIRRLTLLIVSINFRYAGILAFFVILPAGRRCTERL